MTARKTPPAPEAAPAPAPPEVEQDQDELAGEDPGAEVALYPRRLVRHTYGPEDARQVRYGLVVDPDGPLVAWFPQVEDVGHLGEDLEGL